MNAVIIIVVLLALAYFGAGTLETKAKAGYKQGCSIGLNNHKSFLPTVEGQDKDSLALRKYLGTEICDCAASRHIERNGRVRIALRELGILGSADLGPGLVEETIKECDEYLAKDPDFSRRAEAWGRENLTKGAGTATRP